MVYGAEIVIDILNVDISSPAPAAGLKRRRSAHAALWCHDSKRRPMISTTKLNGRVKEM